MINVKYEQNQILQNKHTKKFATIVNPNEEGATLVFNDGTEANFPWRYIISDFDKVMKQ